MKPYVLKEGYSERIDLMKQNLKFKDENKNEYGRYGTQPYDIYPKMTSQERNFIVYMSGYTQEELEQIKKTKVQSQKTLIENMKILGAAQGKLLSTEYDFIYLKEEANKGFLLK